MHIKVLFFPKHASTPCVHMCTHEYMHICTNAHMHVCMYAYMYVCIYAYMHTCICVYVYNTLEALSRMWCDVDGSVYVCIGIHAYMHIYIWYAYMHICTHAYMYMHMYVQSTLEALSRMWCDVDGSVSDVDGRRPRMPGR